MWFTRISIVNPVFATMLMLALLVLGSVAYQRLSVEEFPGIEFPIVVVSTDFPGAAPEAVESDVSRPIEQAVNSIAGMHSLTSRSYEGRSIVIAEFDLKTDPLVAVQDVREKVAGIRAQLHRDVEEPVISRFDPDEYPVMSVALGSERRSLRELTTLADNVVRRRLESVHGVGSVTLSGGTQREVVVHLRPADMEALGVSVEQIVRAVSEENQDLPAGALSSAKQELMVRVQGRVRAVDDFRDFIVARRGESAIRLWQVADVADGESEQESMALINGQRTLAIDIVKAQGANTLAVVDAVKRELERLRADLPADIKVQQVRDTSDGIRNSVANVKQTIIEGGVLTVLIVFLFLASWRSTVITGLTLPISLIGSFSVMLLFDFSLNTMTLMAMSLCVGLLIDDAIVVRENITRHLAMGKSHRQAALEGTQEIGLAVLATTLTLCAVFVPVAFMGGIIGQFFYPFGIVVVSTVLLSMLVSFTLDPMLSSVWHDPAASGAHGTGPLARLLTTLDIFQQRTSARYRGLVAWSLQRRKTVWAIALGSLVGSLALVPVIGTEFVPEADLGELLVHVNTAPGSSLEYTAEKVRLAETALREFPEVTFTYSTINTGFVVGKEQAVIFLRLVPRTERALPQDAMIVPIRERLQSIAGLEVTNIAPYSSISGNKPLQVSIQGQDIAVLDRLGQRVVEAMRGIGGVVDTESSLKAGKPTLDVRLDRDAASDLGLGAAEVTALLRPMIAGQQASSWEAPDGERYDVRVRLAPQERRDQADLERLQLTLPQPAAEGNARIIALRQIAAIEPGVDANRIDRRDLSREISISANVSGRSVGDVNAELEQKLETIQLPSGYRFSMGGVAEDMDEATNYTGQALFLAVVFIYMILASQFRSFLQPLAIMVSLPLSLSGVLIALLLTGSTLNVFSIIGFIMLMGLVTKNAILLVDFINQSVAAGSTRHDAILQAAEARLRPILMTTAAMVFGMLPLALAIGDGAEQRASMAHAVIGGVIASTFLTLLVVPSAYCLFDDLGRWCSGKFARSVALKAAA